MQAFDTELRNRIIKLVKGILEQNSLIVDVTPSAVAELGLAPGAAVWLTAKATDLVAYPEGDAHHGVAG